MTNSDLDILKQKMKDYRDIFGNQLNRIDLIDDAKNLIDLENIIKQQIINNQILKIFKSNI